MVLAGAAKYVSRLVFKELIACVSESRMFEHSEL
jgi:hypothetical protein